MLLNKFKLTITITLISCLLVGCSTGPEEAILHDKRGLYSADISTDGSLSIISSVDRSAQLWDNLTAKKLHYLQPQNVDKPNISFTKISSDGQIAVTADDQTITVWGTKTGQALSYWNVDKFINGISLSANGRYCLISKADANLLLVDLQYGSLVWQVKFSAYIEAINLSNDAKYAIVATDDNYVTIYHIATNSIILQFAEKNKVSFVSISPQNNYALSSSSFQPINIWDLNTGTIKYKLKEFSGGILGYLSRPIILVSSATFSDDEDLLITGAPPRDLYLWNLENGKLQERYVIPKLRHFKPTAAIVYGTAISKDKTQIFAETSNGYHYMFKID